MLKKIIQPAIDVLKQTHISFGKDYIYTTTTRTTYTGKNVAIYANEIIASSDEYYSKDFTLHVGGHTLYRKDLYTNQIPTRTFFQMENSRLKPIDKIEFIAGENNKFKCEQIEDLLKKHSIPYFDLNKKLFGQDFYALDVGKILRNYDYSNSAPFVNQAASAPGMLILKQLKANDNDVIIKSSDSKHDLPNIIKLSLKKF